MKDITIKNNFQMIGIIYFKKCVFVFLKFNDLINLAGGEKIEWNFSALEREGYY
jgi:hypothetical protein